MNFVLLFIINQLNLNCMLKYALIENVLALNPYSCVAVVSSPETKDLNDVINFIVAEGTGLTRLNDIKFKYSILLFCLLGCFTSCKSVTSAKSRKIEIETVWNSEKEVEEMIKMQWNQIFNGHSESTVNSETAIETLTVKFDTSITDSITKQHPFFCSHKKYSPAALSSQSGCNGIIVRLQWHYSPTIIAKKRICHLFKIFFYQNLIICSIFVYLCL